MGILTSAVTAAVLLIPAEWHIDCSGCNKGAALTEIDIRITAMDGTVFTTGMRLGVEPKPLTAQALLSAALGEDRFSMHEVGESILVIRAYKKSAIRSVEFTSKGWKPAVRWVPLPPEKKK